MISTTILVLQYHLSSNFILILCSRRFPGVIDIFDYNLKIKMTFGKSKWNIKNIPFINRNLVTIIMIPSIIGIHYGWVLLQENEALVQKDERIELPIVAGSKLIWKKITGGEEDGNSK